MTSVLDWAGYVALTRGEAAAKSDEAWGLRRQGMSVTQIARAMGVRERSVYRYFGVSDGGGTSNAAQQKRIHRGRGDG